MNNTKIAADRIPKNRNVVIKAGQSKEVLRLEPTGVITWTLEGKEVRITDHKLLCIALLDVVMQLSGTKYDFSKLDPKLYKAYRDFLTKCKL